MQTNLFRKRALEKISSPEQLDMFVEITTGRGWLALLAIGINILFVILWGFYGSLPTKVKGQGIIIKNSGVFDIVSISSGQIIKLPVKVGDKIKKGDTIAILSQPELKSRVDTVKEQLENLKERLQRLKTRKEDERRKEYLEAQKSLIKENLAILKSRTKWYIERIENQKILLNKGLITKTSLLNTKREFQNLKEKIEAKKNELNHIDIQKMDIDKNKDDELKLLQQRIDETTLNLTTRRNQLELNRRLVSTYSGKVVELKVKNGTLVTTGQSIVTLELIDKNSTKLETILYVSPVDGKKIKLGMKVQIAPSTVKTEEYGFILGKVKYVSMYPVTSQQMMLKLQNSDLVRKLSQGGAPIEVHTTLSTDKKTYSGYKWSSSSGPPVKIQSGTLCIGSITVKVQRPASLVIPLLKEKLGI